MGNMAKRTPTRLEAGQLYDYAVKLLGGCAYATGEMRQKLRRRAARAEDVEATLGRLKEHGYLDDDRFASGYAAARLENGGLGARRVLRDLAGRRVAPATAQRAVGKIYAEVNEEALAEDFLRRKYRGRGELLEAEKDLAAAWRRLLRAGFAPDTAMRVLKRFAKNPELLDGFEPPEESPEE